MSLASIPITAALLSAFVSQPSPWLGIRANSDQRQPVYLGLAPLELARGAEAPRGIPVPGRLRALGESQLAALARALGRADAGAAFEVEAWPAQDDLGQLTWALARWRPAPDAPWTWLDDREQRLAPAEDAVAPFLPHAYHPWRERELHPVFDDFLLMGDLYAKPVFGDCVWTTEDGSGLYGAWLDPDRRDDYRAEALSVSAPGRRPVCRVIPQPARSAGQPLSLALEVRGGSVAWPAEISWSDEPRALPSAPAADYVPAWPGDFDADYESDVRALSGDSEAVFPVSGRRLRFERKESADPSNQLGDLVAFLEERYSSLGIRTRRVSFEWRGIPQADLVAVIPGSAPPALNRPVLLADHIDTAFCEDAFAWEHRRVSAPGADDNDTAVATLLRASETLRDSRPFHDIWLVHLTGEEFPGDDLGARRLVSEMLARGQEISGVVLMDMIGWHHPGDGLFQISAGNSEASLRIASLARDSALRIAPPAMVPVVRTRFDERSYLYNTDGLVFSDAGYPVILLNEHLNALENLNRRGYHQTTDTVAKVDFGFASAIARVAIRTAAALAGASGSAR